MPFYRVKLDYVVETNESWPQVDINDLIEHGLSHEVPDAIQILPGSRYVLTRLQRPPKAKL